MLRQAEKICRCRLVSGGKPWRAGRARRPRLHPWHRYDPPVARARSFVRSRTFNTKTGERTPDAVLDAKTRALIVEVRAQHPRNGREPTGRTGPSDEPSPNGRLSLRLWLRPGVAVFSISNVFRTPAAMGAFPCVSSDTERRAGGQSFRSSVAVHPRRAEDRHTAASSARLAAPHGQSRWASGSLGPMSASSSSTCSATSTSKPFQFNSRHTG